MLDRFHKAGDDPYRMAETVFRFGAYIGEVIVRSKNAAWVTIPPDHPLETAWPVVELPAGNLLNPVGKAFKRVENGAEDSIPHFYGALTGN